MFSGSLKTDGKFKPFLLLLYLFTPFFVFF